MSPDVLQRAFSTATVLVFRRFRQDFPRVVDNYSRSVVNLSSVTDGHVGPKGGGPKRKQPTSPTSPGTTTVEAKRKRPPSSDLDPTAGPSAIPALVIAPDVVSPSSVLENGGTRRSKQTAEEKKERRKAKDAERKRDHDILVDQCTEDEKKVMKSGSAAQKSIIKDKYNSARASMIAFLRP